MFRQILVLFIVLLLTGCAAGPNQLGISTSAWQSMSKTEQKKMRADYHQVKQRLREAIKTVYQGPEINVNISEGTVMMPPFVKSFPYQPVTFRIKPGQCRIITFSNLNDTNAVGLRVCYNGLILSLDPSQHDISKAQGSLHLYYNPIWKRGFTYRDLSSSGYVRLNYVNIRINANHTSH